MKQFTWALVLTLTTAASAAGQTSLTSAPLRRAPTDIPADRSAPTRPVAKPSSSRGDRLWNGVAIGAAIGLLAAFTTAAEAPADGKVAIVVGAALVGGCIDARLDINRRPWGRTAPPRRAVMSYTARF